MLFDNPEELATETTEPGAGTPRTSSTPHTRERYAFLKTKRAGQTWYEGRGSRYLCRMGPGGVTVFDTSRWGTPTAPAVTEIPDWMMVEMPA